MVKALFLGFDKTPFGDMGQLLQIARSEATKILHTDKVKVLNILYCPYPKGYVVVVQNPGRKGKIKDKT